VKITTEDVYFALDGRLGPPPERETFLENSDIFIFVHIFREFFAVFLQPFGGFRDHSVAT